MPNTLLIRLLDVSEKSIRDLFKDHPRAPLNVLLAGVPRDYKEPLLLELDSVGLQNPGALADICRDHLRAANCKAYSIVIPVRAGPTEETAVETALVIATDGIDVEKRAFVLRRLRLSTVIDPAKVNDAGFVHPFTNLLNATA